MPGSRNCKRAFTTPGVPDAVAGADANDSTRRFQRGRSGSTSTRKIGQAIEDEYEVAVGIGGGELGVADRPNLPRSASSEQDQREYAGGRDEASSYPEPSQSAGRASWRE